MRLNCMLMALVMVVAMATADLTPSEEDYIISRIIESYNRKQEAKRAPSSVMDFPTEFNNCPQQQPFPCKTADKCISLQHVCDGNYDCPDRWDEDQTVCIAYQRYPAEDLLAFVEQQAYWLIRSFFSSVAKGPKDLKKIADALSTSPNIDIFGRKLGLSDEEKKLFKSALYAVRGNDVGMLEKLGMHADDWTEVKTIFKNLIDSGMISTV